nr:helix-turn-helix domain-containing protein [uncultured Pseudodesulfovibrio sp.]
MKSPQYITEKEVAKIIRVSVSKLQSDRHKRIGIPFHRLGSRTVRYAIEDIRAFMNDCRIEHTNL